MFIPWSFALRRLKPILHHLLPSPPMIKSGICIIFSQVHVLKTSQCRQSWFILQKQGANTQSSSCSAQTRAGAVQAALTHTLCAEDTPNRRGRGSCWTSYHTCSSLHWDSLLATRPAGLWAISNNSIQLSFLEVTVVKLNQSTAFLIIINSSAPQCCN